MCRGLRPAVRHRGEQTRCGRRPVRGRPQTAHRVGSSGVRTSGGGASGMGRGKDPPGSARGAGGPRPWRPTLRRRGGSRPPSRLSPRHQGAHNSHTRTRQAPGLGSSPSWSGANAMRRGEPPQSLARGHEAEHGGEFGGPRSVPVACAHGVTEPHAMASLGQTNPGGRIRAVGLPGRGVGAREPASSKSGGRKPVGVRFPLPAPPCTVASEGGLALWSGSRSMERLTSATRIPRPSRRSAAP
jgi:hypothetical protein